MLAFTNHTNNVAVFTAHLALRFSVERGVDRSLIIAYDHLSRLTPLHISLFTVSTYAVFLPQFDVAENRYAMTIVMLTVCLFHTPLICHFVCFLIQEVDEPENMGGVSGTGN